MRLIFISREQFPNGGAATNRAMALARGLIELGHEVIFILLERQNSETNEFIYQNIRFVPAFPFEYYPDKQNPFTKVIVYLKLVKNAKRIIKSFANSTKLSSVVVFLSRWNKDIIPLMQLSKSLKLKTVHERTEYPFIHAKRTLLGKISLKVNLHLLMPRFDGILVINNALIKYMRKYVGKRMPLEILNMIVDPSRFELTNQDRSLIFPYIAYCGTLNDKKDGVDILVSSFALALSNKSLPGSMKLALIGEYEDDNFQLELEQIITNSGCSDNIVFTGRVNRDDMPGYLINSEALLLSRPLSKQAEGGFPTKLGEYLATGKPVILTRVGEVDKFLKDGINAFLAEPGDAESFAAKIGEVFADYDKALEVGKRGRLLIENEFNYLKEASKLVKFIESL